MSHPSRFVLCLLFSTTFFACNSGEATGNTPETAADTNETPQYFWGTVTYSATAEGNNTSGVELFRDFAASEIAVHFGEHHYRQEEKDGLNAGTIIADLDSAKAVYLNTKDQTWEPASFVDMNNLDPEVRAFLAETFKYELEPTGETETILGYETEKHRVVKSKFIKEGAEVYVWIAKDLHLRPTQYDFETEWKRIIAPLPLSYGFTEGAVLRSVTNEDSVIVTYEVSAIEGGVPDASLFEVPDHYSPASKE